MNNINIEYLTITDWATDGNIANEPVYSVVDNDDNFIFVPMAGTVLYNGVKKTLSNLSPIEIAVICGDISALEAPPAVRAIFAGIYPSVTLTSEQIALINAKRAERGANANLTIAELKQLSKYTSNCTGFSTTSYIKVPVEFQPPTTYAYYVPQMEDIVTDLTRYTSDRTQGTYVSKSFWLYNFNPIIPQPYEAPSKILLSEKQVKLLGKATYIQKLMH